MSRIIHNRARCLVCGDVIESTYRNDIKTCRCGNLTVDGGQDYIRRGYQSEMWENLNVIEKYHWGEAFHIDDGHAWCLGVDLLNTEKTDTGDRYNDCTVYSIDAKQFGPNFWVKEVFVATDGKSVIYQDEDSFRLLRRYAP